MSAWPEAVWITKKVEKSLVQLGGINDDVEALSEQLTTLNSKKDNFDKIITVISTNEGDALRPYPSGNYNVAPYSVFLIES